MCHKWKDRICELLSATWQYGIILWGIYGLWCLAVFVGPWIGWIIDFSPLTSEYMLGTNEPTAKELFGTRLFNVVVAAVILTVGTCVLLIVRHLLNGIRKGIFRR